MLWLLRYVVWSLTWLVLSLRYRVRVVGKDKLRGLKGPILVLPNHPAYIDPPVLMMALWPTLKLHPMVYTGNLANPILYGIVKLYGATEVPDLYQASKEALDKVDLAIRAVIDGLKAGKNQVLWPTGHVQRDGVERLGPARAAADILRAVPEARVVLVRTRGLWGSSFSYAQTQTQPSMSGRMLKGLLWLLASLLLFMPRRRVTLTVEVFDRDHLPEPNRTVLNPFLEKWYNLDGPETPTWVPYHILDRRRHEFPPPPPPASVDLAGLKKETAEAVEQMLADKLGRPLSDADKVPGNTLSALGLDSIDRMDLALQVEQRFGFSGEAAPETVGQLLALAAGLGEKSPPKPPPAVWFKPSTDEGPLAVLGETIPAAFVERALADRKVPAVADDLSGVLTYERLLVGVLTLSKRLAKLEGANVGVLLPASVGCDVALLGLQMAGKLPVVLNWTTGPGGLAHAARVMKLTHVVTSKAFIDRTHVAVEGTQYVYLEDLRRDVSKLELLRTLLMVRWFPGLVRGRVPELKPEQPAVVLFTSGSEKAPKAVPLTHANIIADQRAGAPVLGFTRRDVMLGFLPAFHSFGMTVTSLMPILTGMRVVHHPDPTDAGSLARKAVAYGVTVLIGTPTFISHILERARPGELDALWLIVTGAEKCPPAVFELCKRVAPQAKVAEGYGVTECAPVVAANPPPAPKAGSIGKPLPGVDVIAVDLETDETLPPGKMGMLMVSGPTVFPGYIAHDGPSPFVERDGKRWYVTGDLGEFDEDGYIWFKGRLKRFLKAGGEMISLPALEEPFARLHPPTEEGPSVAVEGIETDHGRRIVLFTTRPLSLREANELLFKEGFRGVMRLDEVRRVDRIPVLGTGKTDYKALRAQIQEATPASV